MMTSAQAWAAMPKRIKIGYHVFKVVEITADESIQDPATLGVARLMREKIALVTGMTPAKLANTLLHEINHAIVWFQADHTQKDEESYVVTITNGLCMVMLDNPTLMPWIKKCLESK